MQELWRPVVGYEGFYAVSNTGLVKRVAHSVQTRRGTRYYGDKLLKPGINTKGYKYVILKSKSFTVHKLVLTAFVGPKPNNFVACHGVKGKLDNSIANLSWGTLSKNLGADKMRDGTMYCGSRNHLSKLTTEKVVFIRNNCPHKITYAEAAAMFNVDVSTLRKIVNKVIWKQIP